MIRKIKRQHKESRWTHEEVIPITIVWDNEDFDANFLGHLINSIKI